LKQKVAAPVQKTEINDRVDLLPLPRNKFYTPKSVLTSPSIGGGRSVGIVCLRIESYGVCFCLELAAMSLGSMSLQ
jgi:hypothetical protein